MSSIKNKIDDNLQEQKVEGRKDQAAGAWKEAKGKVKKRVGDATGDERLEAEGQAQEASGAIKKRVGDAWADVAGAAKDLIT